MDIANIKIFPLEAGILHISLNRPEQLNALDQATLKHLLTVFQQAQTDKSVRALLITGAGKGFCAGADIKELAFLDEQQGLAFARFGQSVFQCLQSLGKPSLAAVHGFALGGGCELAMAATLRIAANTAVWGQPEIKLGVMPGFGGTQRLARYIGQGRAMELCLSGRRFTTEEAWQWGLVNEMTTPENLLLCAKTLLAEIVAMSPIAVQNIMTAIQQGYDLPLKEACALEATYFAACCTSQDKKEGVTAFLEKRKPIFTGA
jgi:enoyl-CoA hydratase